MKTLLKASLLSLGLAVVSVPAFAAARDKSADGARRPALKALMERRAKVRGHAIKKLDLTADQKTQLQAKRSETKSALQALRADTSLTKEQKRAKAQELLKGARTTMRSTLNADQQAQLDQGRERARERLRKALRGRRAL
jgi:hypothetical protein